MEIKQCLLLEVVCQNKTVFTCTSRNVGLISSTRRAPDLQPLGSLVGSSGVALFLCDSWSQTLSLMVICLLPHIQKLCVVSSCRSLLKNLVITGQPGIKESRLGGPTAECLIWCKTTKKQKKKYLDTVGISQCRDSVLVCKELFYIIE